MPLTRIRVAVELDEAGTWTDMAGAVSAVTSRVGRWRGLDPHRAGSATIDLDGPPAADLPAGLGGVAQRATAQGDRIRIRLRIGDTSVTVLVGWIEGVSWRVEAGIHRCTIQVLDALGVLGFHQAKLPASTPAETTGARLRRLLGQVGWPHGFAIPDGTVTCTGGASEGNAATLAQQIAGTDPGRLVVTPSTTAPITFLPAGYTPGRTLQVSDQAATAGVRWASEPTVQSAEDLLVNRVDYRLVSDNTARSRQNDASVTAYGTRPLRRIFASDAERAEGVADHLLSTYAQPISLPRRAVVSLHAEPSSRAIAAARIRVGDQLQMIVEDDGAVTTSDGIVEGIGWSMSPTAAGAVAQVTFSVGSADLASAAELPVELPDLPALTPTAGVSWSYRLPAATGGTGGGFTYQVTGLPSWVSFNATSLLLSGTPPATGGPWTLTYRATDKTDTDSFAEVSTTLTLRYDPVTVAAVADVEAVTGASVSVVLPAASGGTRSGFTYRISGQPSWLSLSGRTMSGTAPSVSGGGPWSVTYRATDRGNTSLSASRTFRVTLVSGTITWAAIDDVTVRAGDVLSVTVPAATGGSGRGFTYAATGLAGWMAFSGRVLSGTAPYAAATTTVTVTVTDTGTSRTATRSFTVRVVYVTPTISAQPNITVQGLGRVNVTLPEGQGGSGSFTYRLTGKPSWLSLSGRRLSGTAPSTASNTALTWTATDAANPAGTASTSFRVRVTLPTLTLPAVADISVPQAGLLSQVLPEASGGYGQGVTYSASGLPSWASFAAGSRTLSGRAGASNASSSVTYRATDQVNSAVTASRGFALAVVNPPTPTFSEAVFGTVSIRRSTSGIWTTSSLTYTWGWAANELVGWLGSDRPYNVGLEVSFDGGPFYPARTRSLPDPTATTQTYVVDEENAVWPVRVSGQIRWRLQTEGGAVLTAWMLSPVWTR